MTYQIIILMLSIPFILDGQALTGYTVKEDTTYFIFDERDYNTDEVKNITVTGSFRSWSQVMNDPIYNLSKVGKHIWTLPFYNPSYNLIPPGAEFKFRINEGIWMDPPPNAPNVRGGNLIFLHDVLIPSLKAEITSAGTIWIHTSGFERPLKASEYVLHDANGNEIAISEMLPNTSAEALLRPAESIDKRKVYYLSIPKHNLRVWCSYDGWFRHLYSEKELGANISSDGSHTMFRIFSPRADKVKLYLYKGAEDKEPYSTIEMKADQNMVWEAKVEGNLKSVFYDFTVHGPTDMGNHFYETLPKHISDPYARVNMEAWGRSMVWEKTTPATPLKGGIPHMKDVIAYEVHVQDFTDRLPVDKSIKGTFDAMVKPGLKNSRGEKIGFDHLLDLGINTVHLMPVQEFMHHPDDVWKESFKDDPYMIEQGIAEENYQWGYRTSHALAIENKFRNRSTSPGEERNQFRDLVQAFHDKGVAVIVDIVPNHTAEDMDGNWFFHMNVLDKIYYFRTRDLDHIGEYGNEVKTENRPMVQKWLIDQCLSLINEFGIDGFRIDLAGQIDQQTLIKLKDAIGHDKILYGEAWIGSNDPEFENNPDWDWYKADSPITFFQDDSRNAFKGPVFDLKSQEKDRGWPGGNYGEREKVMRGLSCTFAEDVTTTSGINYLDIHDNWALADQFALSDWDGNKGVDHDIYKIAALLLYTSVGPIVTHGGTEFMRSKGHAPLQEVVKTLKNGVTMYWHGKRDTYNHRTANQFVWENIGRTRDSANPNDYKGMLEFWKGLNRFRLSEIGEIFRIDGAT
ncbi:MAG: pullulanase, partial [Saprospiraceae bacterium]|nr:pullulanase [Saprospiraceae bacterium]